ncbi:MAG TPA: gluconokinase [Dermatophilaceae bacterium]|nr:gluconokinase [Dermatophilaceae bacterium]
MAAATADTRVTPVLVVMGVSGSGKSTVAALLAGHLGWDLQEGDDLHPQANIAKMAAGEPLTDEDRWPWLDRVAGWIAAHAEAGRPGIITCSALKRSYRDRLRGGYQDSVVFVHLAGTRRQLAERLGARLDHFMPPALLQSQLGTLEELGPEEQGVVVNIGAGPTQVAEEALERLLPWIAR